MIANRGKGVKRVAKKLVFDKCLSCQAKIGKKKNWKKSMINRYRQSHPLYAAAEKEAVAVGKLRKLKDTMGNLTIE